MFTYKQKLDLMKGLMWDYNIPADQCLDVLEGKQLNVEHYNEVTLFRKLIEAYPWFTIMDLLSKERLLDLMTDQAIHSLRYKSLTTHYEFIRSRLQENLSASR